VGLASPRLGLGLSLRLLLRFNLAFLPLIAVSFCGAGYIFRQQFRRTAEEEVLEDARVMMQTARASRVYTTSQIAPLLDHEQSRVYQAIESVHQMLDEHLPAVLRKAIDRLPSQRGKQVTPDRAIEWEADFVNLFIKTPGQDGVLWASRNSLRNLSIGRQHLRRHERHRVGDVRGALFSRVRIGYLSLFPSATLIGIF
jgi:hypothetical protein